MITELKEAIGLMQDGLLVDPLGILERLVPFLEAQEARLREWEVKEKCSNPFCKNGITKATLCIVCDGTGSTAHPATFDDVMDAIDCINKYQYYVNLDGLFLPDGRELRRKG